MKDATDSDKSLTHALGFSSLVYFSNKFITKHLNDLGIEFQIVNHKEMKCLIAEIDDITYVAFRGTETTLWSNWKRILNIIPRKFLHGLLVHGGFKLYHKEYEPIIKPILNKISTKDIIFTGHSLGAAVASMFKMSYGSPSTAIVFASPNILFNSLFVSVRMHSYQIKKDFVTWIPFSLPFLEWSKPSSTLKVKSKYNGFNLISYHSLENYINSIIS